MSAQPQMPALIGKRKLFMLFAPLAILVTAAVVTNFGGGVSKDAHAATVNVSATVLPSITLTMCGGGSQHLRASDDAVFTDSGYTTPGVNGSWAFNIDSAGSAFSGSTCALGYTVSNQANRAISVADAAGGGNFLSAYYGDKVSACGTAIAAQEVGIRVASVAGAGATVTHTCTPGAPADGAQWGPLPTADTSMCQSGAAGVAATCTIAIGVKNHASTLPPAGSITGALSVTL